MTDIYHSDTIPATALMNAAIWVEQELKIILPAEMFHDDLDIAGSFYHYFLTEPVCDVTRTYMQDYWENVHYVLEDDEPLTPTAHRTSPTAQASRPPNELPKLRPTT